MEKKSSAKRPLSFLREFSAGGVVFKKESDVNVVWLVAKSSPSSLFPEGFWRLPKGWIDDEEGGKKPGSMARGDEKVSEEELQKAAMREVAEEGGIKAEVVKKITTEKYFYTASGKRILKFVTFYLMEWIKDLLEGPGFETSEVLWLSYEEARKKLKHLGERRILDEAKAILDSGIQVNLI